MVHASRLDEASSAVYAGTWDAVWNSLWSSIPDDSTVSRITSHWTTVLCEVESDVNQKYPEVQAISW